MGCFAKYEQNMGARSATSQPHRSYYVSRRVVAKRRSHFVYLYYFFAERSFSSKIFPIFLNSTIFSLTSFLSKYHLSRKEKYFLISGF